MADDRDKFAPRVARQAERRVRRRNEKEAGIYFAASTFGIVGWSIAVPTVLALALGVWLDRWVETHFSWTLALLLGGVTLGCLNAWYWVSEQQRGDDEEHEADREEEGGA